MLYSADQLYRPTPLHICSLGRFNSMVAYVVFDEAVGLSSQAWPANNRALYTPLAIPARFTAARFFALNSTGLTGNVDIGLYDSNGNRLISTGTTARAGSAASQYIGVTDQSFPPGHYYVALVCSSTSGTFQASGIVGARFGQMNGLLQEDLGSTVLPTSMTPVTYTGTIGFLYGLTQSDAL